MLVVGTATVAETANVAKAAEVSVASGVLVGVSVGGIGVEVGIASWVCATIVNAAASAVCWISAGFTVGTGCAPHALIVNARIRIKEKNRMCFIV